jgi:hypothetical protein
LISSRSLPGFQPLGGCLHMRSTRSKRRVPFWGSSERGKRKCAGGRRRRQRSKRSVPATLMDRKRACSLSLLSFGLSLSLVTRAKQGYVQRQRARRKVRKQASGGEKSGARMLRLAKARAKKVRVSFSLALSLSSTFPATLSLFPSTAALDLDLVITPHLSPPLSAQHSRHAVDDRGPLPV